MALLPLCKCRKKKGPNLLDYTFAWAMATDMCKEP